jgi:RNA polymerase sigma-70 factor (ECF subfamily)
VTHARLANHGGARQCSIPDGPPQAPLDATDESAARSPEETARLARRAQSGDTTAFAALARQYLRPAYSLALAVVRRPEDAEDVSQAAILVAFEHIDSCRAPDRFASWLMSIVRNHARNHLRARKLRDPVELSDAVQSVMVAPEGPGDGSREQVLRALSELPPKEREAVLLHDLAGCTHGEIAHILDISEVASRQHLFLARQKLRQELRDDDQ